MIHPVFPRLGIGLPQSVKPVWALLDVYAKSAHIAAGTLCACCVQLAVAVPLNGAVNLGDVDVKVKGKL